MELRVLDDGSSGETFDPAFQYVNRAAGPEVSYSTDGRF